jgi:parallel beta-helix repeat protein
MKNVFFKNGTVFFMVLLLMFCFYPSSTLGFKQDLKLLVFNDGNTLYVGGMGPGNYTSIQGAIDDADSGDTVFVFDDSSPYFEHLFLNKTISLVGENRNSTVVDAQHIGSVLEIYDDGCLVSGFTLKNCSKPFYENNYFDVVKIVDSNNVTIRDNILSIGEIEYNAWVSVIYLYNSCYCNISDNVIFELDKVSRSEGVCFSSNSCYNTISGNIISNYIIGIGFRWNESCDGNIIIGNHISNNNAEGISLDGCNDNRIMDNVIEYNEGWGIWLDDAVHTIVSGNIIRYNGMSSRFTCGIILIDEGCRFNTISGNVISNNTASGIQVVFAFDNVITGNNFIDNGNGNHGKEWGNAYFSLPFKLKSFIGANNWDGNFWSDYKGFRKKIIPGDIFIIELFGLGVCWFQFDRHPAQEPYDI